MNIDDYAPLSPVRLRELFAELSTTRLLELFAEAARRIGIGRKFWNISDPSKVPSGPPQTSSDQTRADRDQSVAVIWVIGKTLGGRAAIPEITALFDDDDHDVRYEAARLFGDIDPEAATAATHSFYAQLPTREVLALRRRARETPPDRPTLREMPDDALVARFEDAAAREGAAQFLDPIDEPEDQETQNRIGVEVADVLEALKARDLLSRLAPLLSSRDLTVRYRAAQGCLRLAEREAVAALESVVAGGKFDEALRARDALDDWRKGKCLIDAL